MPEFLPDVATTKKVPNIQIPDIPEIQYSTCINIKKSFTFPLDRPIFGKYAISVMPSVPQLSVPGEGLPRVIHYVADQAGCAFWRMLWPAEAMLAHNRAVVMTLYTMHLHALFYAGVDAVRLQRQCTPAQRDFIKNLRDVSNKYKEHNGKGFRIIWEVDDICLPKEDIPDFNVCKTAFNSDEALEIVKDITNYVDEIVVVSEPMKEHYKKHLGFDRISVIPNYAPKHWLDRNITDYERLQSYRKNKKKPRILYAGSNTHFDLANKTNQRDDFFHITNLILKDLQGPKKYQWVFLGGVSPILQQFVGKGVEVYPWAPITEYPQRLKEMDATIMIAPLQDNTFNRSKADIKIMEAGALGIPIIAQDLDCYNRNNEWKYLFTTGEQMFGHITQILSSEKNYLKAINEGREYANKRWLKDHLDEWMLLYTTDYGSPERAKNSYFLDNNKSQFNS